MATATERDRQEAQALNEYYRHRFGAFWASEGAKYARKYGLDEGWEEAFGAGHARDAATAFGIMVTLQNFGLREVADRVADQAFLAASLSAERKVAKLHAAARQVN
jgi:hypothetical protein